MGFCVGLMGELDLGLGQILPLKQKFLTWSLRTSKGFFGDGFLRAHDAFCECIHKILSVHFFPLGEGSEPTSVSKGVLFPRDMNHGSEVFYPRNGVFF